MLSILRNRRIAAEGYASGTSRPGMLLRPALTVAGGLIDAGLPSSLGLTKVVGLFYEM
jgi:hypothetical protein